MEPNMGKKGIMAGTATTDIHLLARPIGRREVLTRAAVLGLAAPVLGRTALPVAAQAGPAGTVTFALLGDPTLNPFT